MSNYLGYDRGALGVLLGALGAVHDERFAEPALRTPSAQRVAVRAGDVHRRSVAGLSPFADVAGAILRGDPLGRFPAVTLDVDDLSLWALHRGGRWSTVTDPTPTGGTWPRELSILNARLVGQRLTPERLADLLGGDGKAVAPFVRYVERLASDPAARSALLDTLGPERFGALVAVAAERFTATHLWGAADQPGATWARRTLDGLGGLWAPSRAAGERRNEAWGEAALGGPLYGASRLLGLGAATAGALSTDELAGWGATQWRRLASGRDATGLARPELVGDQILVAVSVDGRAARRFVLDLASGRDRVDLAALLSNSLSAPEVSGRLVLASTDPSTRHSAADEDEVRRSVQAVLRVVDHLLAEDLARPPVVVHGRVDAIPGRTLPVGLGLYTGRELGHLIDACDGAGEGCARPSDAWAGWDERETARLLVRLAEDEQIAVELQEAAWASGLRRLARTDLLAPGADEAVWREAFTLGALDGIVGDQLWDRAQADHARFHAMAAGLDLGVDAASLALPGVGPAARVAIGAWGPVSNAGAALGPSSLTEALLPFLRPEPLDDTRARTEAVQSLDTARLKAAAGTIVETQHLARTGGPAAANRGPVHAEVDGTTAARAAATRPGDNANAAAYEHLASVDGATSNGGRGSRPVADQVGHVQAVIGDAMAEGRAWVA